MPLIAKRVRLLSHTHKSWCPLVEPLHHGFIQDIHPGREKVPSHIVVEILLHLPHMEKAIIIWHLHICVTKVCKYVFKSLARHDMVKSKRSALIH
jgi:hypothetical protein